MSQISNLIFHGKPHKLSSPYGYRDIIKTSNGNTSPFHNGADYSTYGKKIAQYAIEDGTVLSCGIDYAFGQAKYVWVKYSRLGVKMLHYHLDSIKVKTGQKVNKNTVLGYTGKSGKATGIHLHLAIKSLSGGGYIDPEKWSEEVYKEKENTNEYSTGKYVVDTALLNVRSGPSSAYSKKKFSQLSKNAQKQILSLCQKERDGYVKGVTFCVSQIQNNFGKTPSGWVCLDYCKVIST